MGREDSGESGRNGASFSKGSCEIEKMGELGVGAMGYTLATTVPCVPQLRAKINSVVQHDSSKQLLNDATD